MLNIMRMPDVIDYPDVPEKGQPDIEKFEQWFKSSEKWKEPYTSRWRKNEQMYYVGYYGEIEEYEQLDKNRVIINMVLADIETQIPHIKKMIPIFDVMPKSRNDVMFADIMQYKKTEVIEESGFMDTTVSASKDMLIYGNGFLCEEITQDVVNSELKRVKIRVKSKALDPFTVFPKPHSTTLDIFNGCGYLIIVKPHSIEEINEQYGKELVADSQEECNKYRSHRERYETGELEKIEEILVKRCYYVNKQYPNGRCVIWAGKEILSDTELWGVDLTDKKTGYKPGTGITMVSQYKTEHVFFGTGEPVIVESLNQSLNRIITSIVNHVEKTGDPEKLINRAIKDEIKQWKSGKYYVQTPTDILYLEPPHMAPETIAVIELLVRMNNIVTGIYDAMQGASPERISAASAIQALQEAGLSRVIYKVSDTITKNVVERGKFIIHMIKSVDTEISNIRLAEYEKEKMQLADGRQINTPKFIDFDPQKKYNKTGAEDNVAGMTISDSQLDIEVVSGVSLPKGRYEEEQMALKKFKLGIYGIEEYVERSGEKDKREIIKNFERRQGVSEMMKRLVEQEKAEKELRGIVGKANGIDSVDEIRVAELIEAFPDILNSPEFGIIPIETKLRIIKAVFVSGTDEGIPAE